MPGMNSREFDGRIYVADEIAERIVDLDELSSAVWRLTCEPVTIEDCISVFKTAFPSANKKKLKKRLTQVFDYLFERGLIY
jgi:hypothetical protein